MRNYSIGKELFCKEIKCECLQGARQVALCQLFLVHARTASMHQRSSQLYMLIIIKDAHNSIHIHVYWLRWTQCHSWYFANVIKHLVTSVPESCCHTKCGTVHNNVLQAVSPLAQAELIIRLSYRQITWLARQQKNNMLIQWLMTNNWHGVRNYHKLSTTSYMCTHQSSIYVGQIMWLIPCKALSTSLIGPIFVNYQILVNQKWRSLGSLVKLFFMCPLLSDYI